MQKNEKYKRFKFVTTRGKHCKGKKTKQNKTSYTEQ